MTWRQPTAHHQEKNNKTSGLTDSSRHHVSVRIYITWVNFRYISQSSTTSLNHSLIIIFPLALVFFTLGNLLPQPIDIPQIARSPFFDLKLARQPRLPTSQPNPTPRPNSHSPNQQRRWPRSKHSLTWTPVSSHPSSSSVPPSILIDFAISAAIFSTFSHHLFF